MLRDNKITKRIKYTNGIGRPNKLIYWYDKEIVATANGDLSKYASDDFYIYSSGLDLVYNSSEMSNYYFSSIRILSILIGLFGYSMIISV